jgi:hypothetical protein
MTDLMDVISQFLSNGLLLRARVLVERLATSADTITEILVCHLKMRRFAQR